MNMKRMILLFVLVAGVQAIFAQQTDFTGTWAVASTEHIAGPQYGNALPKQMEVKQGKDSLYIESTSLGGDGKDITARTTYAMDGKPITATNAATKRKYVRKLEWSVDKKSMTLTT